MSMGVRKKREGSEAHLIKSETLPHGDTQLSTDNSPKSPCLLEGFISDEELVHGEELCIFGNGTVENLTFPHGNIHARRL